jgi:hypothetical protein
VADLVFLAEGLEAGQPSGQAPGLNLCPEELGELLVERRRRVMINNHMITVGSTCNNADPRVSIWFLMDAHVRSTMRTARAQRDTSGGLAIGTDEEGQVMDPATVSKEQASALADLQFHWDERYGITLEDGTWSARWRGTGEVMTADSDDALRQLIREDYQRRQWVFFVGLHERMST